MLALALALDIRIMASAALMLAVGLLPYLLSVEPLALFCPGPAPRLARWVTLFSRAPSYRATTGYLCVWRGLFLRNVVHLCPTAKIQAAPPRPGDGARQVGRRTTPQGEAPRRRRSRHHRRSRAVEQHLRSLT